ncbi:oxygenase MpaB family protein [Streptacidiphilus rugosus]|uniref:oxygenase MpaB family protein n=1 Tax=Streptacidiphilus rugosus TaxID=405783 RepID=UPI00056CD61F|nr:oxygenase MpaB family protein [Streptacidiphilus rugosus]
MVLLSGSDSVREWLGSALFARVAGPEGPETRERIHGTPGPRWFAPDRPIRTVHGDASMFVGGLTALLLQSLHPLVMGAVATHSGYRSDPWGRLQRTSAFLATTTFGTAEDAQRAVDAVRAVHERIAGTAEDGTPYRASDPHLLGWVHAAEVDCFLRAHQRYGASPLTPAACDAYVTDTAVVARALGVVDPPQSTEDLAAVLTFYRGELRSTAACEEAMRFLLLRPPVPLLLLPGYASLASAAVHLLPRWARPMLHLPPLPLEAVTAPLAGRAVVGAVRWALPTPPDPHAP